MAGVGLYVHVPFCARACPYCDFDFVVGRRPDVDRYLEGLRRELEERAVELSGAPVETLYLGGGTPSLLGPAGLERLVELLAEFADLGSSRESTIEVNPEHADGELLDAVVSLGFDRVSLGIQSFQASTLRALGRAHSPSQATAALAEVRARGLTVSVDLIVGVPGQDEELLAADLRCVGEGGPDHVSAYALTIEGEVPWVSLVRRGLRVLPDDDLQAPQLVRVAEGLEALGYGHYEISSYARGPRARARHNARYWSGKDVIALGPSAHSSRHWPGKVERRANPRGLEAWLRGEAPALERLDGEAAAAEALWLALRQLDGVAMAELMARHPSLGSDWWSAKIAPGIVQGNLEIERSPAGTAGSGRIRVAPGRWLFHDTIAAQLL